MDRDTDSRDALFRNSNSLMGDEHARGSRAIDPDLSEKPQSQNPRRRKLVIAGVVTAAIIILVLVIVLPVYFTVGKKDKDSESSSASSNGVDNTGTVNGVVSGGNGTEIALEDGSTFVYTNPHGGYWYYDANDPFNNGARAQSWSPALNETFTYGVDKIRGVNLGGWLVIEPFIAPTPFQKYAPDAVDEYTLHTAMAADKAKGGIDQIEDHYKTFITEKDFAEIAGAGLNYIRIPFPYWAIDTLDGEPFLPKVAWKYFLKAIQWARKYGLRINLDLHSVPGSQNGWNHSGRLGSVNFLKGSMGFVNAQRTLDYIRILAEFISQPEYKDVVTMFSIINEAREVEVGQENLARFYAEAYRIVREASGNGQGQGPWVTIGDGQMAKSDWKGYFPGYDRVALDNHPYVAFPDVQSTESWGQRTGAACQWGKEFNSSMSDFGMTIGGEWSLAVNDCGLYVNGVKEGTRYDGTYYTGNINATGSCDTYDDWEKFTDDQKKELKAFMLASMDGLQNFFFWTWKIGPSLESGKIEAPGWSYQLGLENGWIPRDPREAVGYCGNTQPWSGEISQGETNPSIDSAKYLWPPTSIREGGNVTDVYSYTQTGAVPTLTAATFIVSGTKPTKTVDLGSGWNNQDDKTGRYVAVSGCDYLDAWNVNNKSLPTPWCTNLARREAQPTPTAPPSL